MTDPGPTLTAQPAPRVAVPRSSAGTDPGRLGPLFARVALAATAAAVAAIVFSAGPPDAAGQRDLARFLVRQHRLGLPHWVDFAFVEGTANVLLFLPVGFFGALALRRRGALVLPLAALASGFIELVQKLFLSAREADPHDVAMNTLGALLGLLAATPWLLRRRRRRLRARRGHRSARDRPVPS